MPGVSRVLVRPPALLGGFLAAVLVVVVSIPATVMAAAAADANEHRRTITSQTTGEGYAVPVRRRVTYSITTRGRVTASVALFARLAQQTYDDPRGWRTGGVEFRRVRRGGDFTLVLAEASTVPSFSTGCSAQWSCRVGRFVIINQTRWNHASPAWNAGALSLRDYRHMVVNHETGHWLGLGHAGCSGGPAPVMMQQSKYVGACRFNPWPLEREAAVVRR